MDIMTQIDRVDGAIITDGSVVTIRRPALVNQIDENHIFHGMMVEDQGPRLHVSAHHHHAHIILEIRETGIGQVGGVILSALEWRMGRSLLIFQIMTPHRIQRIQSL